MTGHAPAGRRAAVIAVFVASALAALSARGDQAATRQIDPKALGLLQAMDAAFARAEGLVATYRSETFRPDGQPAGTETTTIRLGRPNVYVIETTSPRTRILASDGTTRFSVMPGRCTVSAVAPLNDAREIETFNPLYWSFYDLGQWQIRSAMLGHWSTKWRMSDPGLRSLRYVGQENIGGTPVEVVEWTYTIAYNRREDDPVYTSRLAIGPDHLVRRIETTSTSKHEYYGRRIVETVSGLRTTPRPATAEFAYRPPANTTCVPFNQEDGYTTGKYTDLPIGSKAPDFELKTARGETLRLSTHLAQHKVVLMNYWGYG
jgi:outer membrane lipoprotein-sorting protein